MPVSMCVGGVSARESGSNEACVRSATCRRTTVSDSWHCYGKRTYQKLYMNASALKALRIWGCVRLKYSSDYLCTYNIVICSI